MDGCAYCKGSLKEAQKLSPETRKGRFFADPAVPSARSRCQARALAQETGTRADDPVLLIAGDLGEHRQRQDAAARLLGHRERSRAMAEVSQALLQVQRHRIVHL